MTLSAEARAARNAYMRNYRKKRMTEEQKEREREYQRQWKEDNPDKVQRHYKDYWERKALEMEEAK